MGDKESIGNKKLTKTSKAYASNKKKKKSDRVQIDQPSAQALLLFDKQYKHFAEQYQTQSP